MKNNFNFKYILIGLILVIAAVNTIAITFLTSSVSDSLAKAVELNRPANLSAVVIKSSDCENCFDIDASLEKIKNTNVLIEDEKELTADSQEAQELITKFGIQKLPTIIFTGEIKKDSSLEKAWEGIGEIKDDAVVFTKLTPPYFSVSENRVVGQVAVTYINDKNCTNCVTYKQFVDQLGKSGVLISNESTVDYLSTEGQKLISEYGIATIPTFIFDKEIALYENIANDWSKFGKVAEDGSYVLTQKNAPYRDIADNSVKGLITATHLIDPSCTECLTIDSIKQALSRLGLAYDNEQIVNVDSYEGKSLIEKYQITKVPTLILDKEADAYPALKQVWKQVGTVESDGFYVVRNLSIIKGAKYKDLTTDTITSN